MNNIPKDTIRRIIDKYGIGLANDPRRCENLLNDLCGQYRREINVLVSATAERVPHDLLAGAKSMPLELLLTRIEKQLETQTAMTSEAARWAVESWAFALNLITENEIAERQKQAVSTLRPNTKTERVFPNDSAGGNLSTANTNPIQTSKKIPTVNLPPQTNVPPVVRQPPPVFPANNQEIKPPLSVRRNFGLFRGCLLGFFLLAAASIVLFLGVPYAIEKMRETQRQRNSEPPRFPIR